MSATVNIPSSVQEYLTRREESPSCTSATPDNHGRVPPGSCDNLYPFYDPSFALAGAFAAIFAITTLAHIFQAFYHKKGFCWVIIIGCIMEAASFLLRTASTRKQQSKFLAQQSFMLFALAPVLINAFVYMVCGRLIFCFHPNKRVWKFKAIHIGRIFIGGDVASLLIQAGAAMLVGPGSTDKKKMDIGLKIYQAGIGIQQGFIFLFLFIIITFHRNMHDLERRGWRDSHGRKWKLMIWVLYLVLALITVRIIYRLVEYIIPHEGNPLLENEFYMYVLDAVPMAICLILLNLVHPGRVLVGPESNYRQGKKQMKAELKAAKKAGKHGSDDEESLMGVELHQPQQQPGYGSSPYAPLVGGQGQGVVGAGQQTLYDPHHGRM